MKPVDAHCHIDFERFDGDREEVLERCREELEFIVNAGRDPESNRSAVRLQEENPELVVANLGIHPTYTDSFDSVEEIKKQIREEKPSAVGEIGLDHHHVAEEDERRRQKEVFREMLSLAEEMKLPVVVHTRDAERQAVDILKDYELPGVMLHCFNGTPELASEAVAQGMKIGVSTQVLYSGRVQDIVKRVEVEDILLETDSPFLYRGERNEPVKVLESAEKIAELKELRREEVIQTTTANSQEIFR